MALKRLPFPLLGRALRGECQQLGFGTRQRRLCLVDPNGQAVVEGGQIGVLPLPCLELTALFSEARSCRRHGFGERFNTLFMGRALLTDLAVQLLGLSSDASRVRHPPAQAHHHLPRQPLAATTAAPRDYQTTADCPHTPGSY